MSKIGIYPGSFDPITFGHLDIIQRSLNVVDTLIVAVSDNKSKNHFINIDDRLNLIEATIKNLPPEDQKKIAIEKFDNLLVHYVKAKKASVIIRGLRAVSDFEYEFQMASMNRQLNVNLESVFLTPSEKYAFISSSLVKEVSKLGGDVSAYVSKSVLTKLQHQFS